MTYDVEVKLDSTTNAMNLIKSPSDSGCRKNAGNHHHHHHTSATRKPQFDFVAFDWKGTLEAKLGNKRQREESALAACAKLLLRDITMNTGDIQPADYETQREEIETTITTLLQVFKVEKEAMKKRQGEMNVTCTLQEVFERALDGAQIVDEEKRFKITQTFLQEYNNPNPQHCHLHLTIQCDCKMVSNAPGNLYDGCHALLQRLASFNIPIALIRNSALVRDQFHQNLVHAKAEQYFKIEENVILSGEVGYCKPDRRIFEACVRKCNVEEVHGMTPERILFVGNETDADILGAKQMGWKAALIRSTETTSNGLADFEIDSLHELHEIIFGSNHQQE